MFIHKDTVIVDEWSFKVSSLNTHYINGIL